jgi:DNA polymerase-4
LSEVVVRLAESLERSCARGGYSGKTVTLKVKYGDFTLLTRSMTHSEYVSTKDDIAAFAKSLLVQSWAGKKIRLLGISLSSLKKIDVLEPAIAHLNQPLLATEFEMP